MNTKKQVRDILRNDYAIVEIIFIVSCLLGLIITSIFNSHECVIKYTSGLEKNWLNDVLAWAEAYSHINEELPNYTIIVFFYGVFVFVFGGAIIFYYCRYLQYDLDSTTTLILIVSKLLNFLLLYIYWQVFNAPTLALIMGACFGVFLVVILPRSSL